MEVSQWVGGRMPWRSRSGCVGECHGGVAVGGRMPWRSRSGCVGECHGGVAVGGRMPWRSRSGCVGECHGGCGRCHAGLTAGRMPWRYHRMPCRSQRVGAQYSANV